DTMDRRDFFKSIFFTSLLTPLLLASKKSISDAELYLISDSPHQCLPPLLQELKTLGILSGASYSFPRPSQQQDLLSSALASSGWIPVSNGTRPHMSLTSSRLNNPALPSFTLAREGKIWDLRTRTLRSLWKEINNQSPSSSLTVVSLHSRPAELISGKTASLYKDGKKIKTISLKQNVSHSFRAKNGQILVSVKDGKAWVEDSSCRHKICMNCPPAAYAGERIICAPNQFMLTVDGRPSVDTIIG
ncbi:MAG: NusG domain II-containing protein, partial [Candidatus Aminicenantes bacterium]|nr:NusG domain II-containing protein [Candidatus Aminicenantes bacterium]